jgi:hypothetical protein
MRAGMEDELAAKMDVDKASKMRAQAQKLKDKSEAARRKFVAQEKPVLLAQKLAEHDHKKYRSEELAVAKEVALLSEHPSSKKLRAKVDKLVKHSKEAKKRMAEDGMLLKKLEKKTADAQLGGERWALYRACVFCLLVCARTRLKLLGTAATEQQLAARLVSVPADTSLRDKTGRWIVDADTGDHSTWVCTGVRALNAVSPGPPLQAPPPPRVGEDENETVSAPPLLPTLA